MPRIVRCSALKAYWCHLSTFLASESGPTMFLTMLDRPHFNVCCTCTVTVLCTVESHVS